MGWLCKDYPISLSVCHNPDQAAFYNCNINVICNIGSHPQNIRMQQ